VSGAEANRETAAETGGSSQATDLGSFLQRPTSGGCRRRRQQCPGRRTEGTKRAQWGDVRRRLWGTRTGGGRSEGSVL